MKGKVRLDKAADKRVEAATKLDATLNPPAAGAAGGVAAGAGRPPFTLRPEAAQALGKLRGEARDPFAAWRNQMQLTPFTINQTFNGPADPNQVARATQEAIDRAHREALLRARYNFIRQVMPVPTPALRPP